MIPQEISRLGFTVVSDFQEAWNLGPELVADNDPGPKTMAAAATSNARLSAGLPNMSEHFSAGEFACHCGGKLPGCRKTLVLRPLLSSLEQLRLANRGPIVIVAGYRCAQHNAAVGGAKDSQHLWGAAADVTVSLSLGQVQPLDAFAGIGYMAQGTHRVTHVDRRDRSGHNLTKGTTGRPTTWTYPGA